jgi:hypothetical protein
MHALASITYLLSPADMQDTGHSASHAPQLIHSSFIKYAIGYTPLKYIEIPLIQLINLYYFTTKDEL